MTREISTSDVASGVVERDSDGDLIPEDHDITLPDGETVTVKTKPITTGLLNELSNVDDAIADLDPEAIHEAFQTVYVSDAILDLSVDEIQDTHSEYLTAYLEPLDDAVESDIGGEVDGDGVGNPRGMSRQERAEQMR